MQKQTKILCVRGQLKSCSVNLPTFPKAFQLHLVEILASVQTS